MNEQTRFGICCHEAAHAVVSNLLNSRRVEGLHVFSDVCGYVSLGKLPPYEDSRADIREKYENLIQFSIAGQAATDKAKFCKWTIVGPAPAHVKEIKSPIIIKDRAATFASLIKTTEHDEETELDAVYEERLARKVFPESFRPYIYWLACRARAIVDQHWPTILEIASLLYWQNYVSRHEFLDIVKKHKGAK